MGAVASVAAGAVASVAAGVVGLLLAGMLPVGAAAPAALAPASSPVARVSGGAQPFDFNGDGYADLAIGIPGEDVGGAVDAGAVQVLYGSASGPTAADQLWHQDRRGVKGAAERGDGFGAALASGDFDSDGYADLAVGIPTEALGSRAAAGAVQVLYGGSRGLTAVDQFWHHGSPGVPGVNEAQDHFGATLAAGDFDADGYDDLAVAAPLADVGSVRRAGHVVILPGSARGLRATGVRSWTRADLGTSTELGAGLAAGDVTGDGRDDLLATSGWEGSGRLHVLVGGAAGLATTSRVVDLAGLGLPGGVRAPLAAGDVDGDGRAEAVVHRARAAGGIAVVDITGSGSGSRARMLAGTPSHADSLATGDLTGDGVADLAVGAPSGQLLGARGGVVQVLTGSGSGLRQAATLSQASAGVPGADESGDGFGGSVAILTRAGAPGWLAVGASTEDLGSRRRAGWVVVLPGTGSGVRTAGSRGWHQDSAGVKGRGQAGDRFGAAVGPGTSAPAPLAGGIRHAAPTALTACSQARLRQVTLLSNGLNVDRRCQRIYVTRGGAIIRNWLATTGKPGYTTRAGTWRVYHVVDRWQESTLYTGAWMYRPMYFSGGQAVHGSASDSLVVPWPASHGCVRVYRANIDWLWRNGYAAIGTRVRVF